MTWRRVLAQGLGLLGSWVLVQVPSKDVRLDDPGRNDAPIPRFTRVREFATAGECEAYRDVALQDGACEGSDAMLDEGAQLRRVAAERLLAPTPGTASATS